MVSGKHEIGAHRSPTAAMESSLRQEEKVAASVQERKAMAFFLWTWKLCKYGYFCGFNSVFWVVFFFFKPKPSPHMELDDDGAPSSSGSAVTLCEISPSSHVK